MNSPAGNPYPRRAYAWFVVGVLVLTAVLSYTDRQVLSLLVDPIRHDLGISDTSVSLLLGTAFALVYGVAGLPFGWLADRWSRRNLIWAGILIWSAGTIACGLAGSFAGLFAARIVVGLGESVLSPAAISLISDYFPPARRGLAVGTFLSGIAIGSGAAIMIGGGVLRAVDAGLFSGTPLGTIAPWRLVVLVLGLPGLLWSFVLWGVREPLRQGGTESASGGAIPLARVAPIFAVAALASLVDNAVGAWAPTLLIRGFGLDAGDVGVRLGALLTVGFGAGVLAGGWISDRVALARGTKGKLVVCVVASMLILPVAGAMSISSSAVVMGAVPMYYALSGTVTACAFSAILDAVPGARRGLAMAVSFFLNVAFGAGVGPTLIAFLSDHVLAGNLAAAMTVTTAGSFLLVAIAAIVAGRAAR